MILIFSNLKKDQAIRALKINLDLFAKRRIL